MSVFFPTAQFSGEILDIGRIRRMRGSGKLGKLARDHRHRGTPVTFQIEPINFGEHLGAPSPARRSDALSIVSIGLIRYGSRELRNDLGGRQFARQERLCRRSGRPPRKSFAETPSARTPRRTADRPAKLALPRCAWSGFSLGDKHPSKCSKQRLVGTRCRIAGRQQSSRLAAGGDVRKLGTERELAGIRPSKIAPCVPT